MHLIFFAVLQWRRQDLVRGGAQNGIEIAGYTRKTAQNAC